MQRRALFIGCALLFGCPEARKPESGVELVFKKPVPVKVQPSQETPAIAVASDGGAGQLDGGTVRLDGGLGPLLRQVDGEPIRLAVERRLAALKIKARISEDDDSLTLRMPGANDESVRLVTGLMMTQGHFEMCALDAEVMKTWCELTVLNVSAEQTGSQEGCRLLSSDLKTLQALREVATAERVVFENAHGKTIAYATTECIEPRVATASATENEDIRTPQLSMGFDGAGKKAVGALTTAMNGKTLLLVMDDVVLSAPIVAGAITGGRAMLILPNESMARAEAMAQAVAAGALPKLSLQEQRAYGPTR